MFTNFVFFVITWCYRTYEMYIFVELADNELSGCIAVVGAPSQKKLRNRGLKHAVLM